MSRTSFRELVQEMVNHDCGSQVLSADKAREAAAQDKWSCGGPPRPEPFSSRPGNHAPHFTRL
jgi:hypothetical protein